MRGWNREGLTVTLAFESRCTRRIRIQGSVRNVLGQHRTSALGANPRLLMNMPFNPRLPSRSTCSTVLVLGCDSYPVPTVSVCSYFIRIHAAAGERAMKKSGDVGQDLFVDEFVHDNSRMQNRSTFSKDRAPRRNNLPEI